MEGISAWVDWYPNRLPAVLHGLGIEAAGHDINYGLPAGFSRMRQDTGEGGAIYAWNHFHNFRPYVKYLAGIGSIDFPSTSTYTHDTFSVLSPGAGVEYRAWGHIWIRGDYEYQYWHTPLGLTTSTLTALPSAHLTTSDHRCLSGGRSRYPSDRGPTGRRVLKVALEFPEP